MPYIDADSRSGIETKLEPLLVDIDHRTEGELNYIFTRIAQEWLGEQPSYFSYSLAIGTFECAKLELYRRCVAPYEDKKAIKNGDVYQQREFKPLPAIELPGKDETK